MASNSDRRSSSSASHPRDARGRGPAETPAEEARPAARRTQDPRKGGYYKGMRMVALTAVAIMLVVVGYVVVVYSPLFEIKRVSSTPTEHLTSEAITQLANVQGGTTLFTVDEKGIVERLTANPWVSSVELVRMYPSELLIDVCERACVAIVMLSNGAEAWRIASDGYWLEPVELQTATASADIAAPSDQARAVAAQEGLVYISDVAATVKPEAGAACANEAILAVITYLEGFSPALRSQVVSAKASGIASISMVLSGGIEVSLGTPDDIALKEQVVLGMLNQYAGQLTYINVRMPTAPTWRGLDANQVGDAPADGGGIPEGAVPDAPAPDDGQWDDGQGDDGAWDAGELVGGEEGGPGGFLDEGGYYSDSGYWIYAYHDANGNWINGYYEDDGGWVALS